MLKIKVNNQSVEIYGLPNLMREMKGLPYSLTQEPESGNFQLITHNADTGKHELYVGTESLDSVVLNDCRAMQGAQMFDFFFEGKKTTLQILPQSERHVGSADKNQSMIVDGISLPLEALITPATCGLVLYADRVYHSLNKGMPAVPDTQYSSIKH